MVDLELLAEAVIRGDAKEAILRRFEVDARPLLLGAADRGPDRALSPDAFVDEWGVTWTRPEDSGGYVLCAVHNIQPDVPAENVVAMDDAAAEFGR